MGNSRVFSCSIYSRACVWENTVSRSGASTVGSGYQRRVLLCLLGRCSHLDLDVTN